mgnify:CR=1 FL=1
MRDEYNIRELNPRKNPYASRLKKQITINIDGSTIDYFKSMAAADGIPYQGLCGQSQKNSNVVAVMKKRKNNVFFRFSILLYIYKYSKLQI